MLGAILVIFSILAFLVGLGIFSASTSVLHEMSSGILLLSPPSFLPVLLLLPKLVHQKQNRQSS